VNRPAGSTPGDRHDDLGTRAPGADGSPDGRGGSEAADETDGTDEPDDARRPRAEPPSRLPEGYEPL
jgi:hypothetical protein